MDDDEASAMAAMFQAQTANWEETQEKMSQFVLLLAVYIVAYLMNYIWFFLSSFHFRSVLVLLEQCAADIYQPPWNRIFSRWKAIHPPTTSAATRPTFTSELCMLSVRNKRFSLLISWYCRMLIFIRALDSGLPDEQRP